MLLLLAIAVAGQADQPVWPLNIEISQSSSFAEFRGMRLHAGIDLRTRRTNGFPVVAIADGFISRASVQFRGYGYALYIDHPQLNVRVVYGHLQDFQGPIKEYADAKLKKLGSRHGINDFFTADRFPVKKGQVLALSGETGMGPPHLHFEMRTFADEPVAPALFGYRPGDSIYPVFHHLHIVPMSYACYVNGSFLPASIALHKKTSRNYLLAETPQVFGKFALQAGISDSNGEGNRFGVERVNLEVNGSQRLEKVFHRFSYDHNRQSPWVFDYFKSGAKNLGYVYNLFRLPRETLPFAGDFKPWSGVFNVDEFSGKDFTFAISCEDFGSNKIAATGRLDLNPADFTRMIPAEEIAGFAFDEVRQTDYSLIAVGHRSSAKKMKQVMTGSVECVDKSENRAALPCIVSAERIEIAFPMEKRWQTGAWIAETRILPESILIDRSGGSIAMEAGATAVFKSGSLHEPLYCRLARSNVNPAPGGNSKRGLLKPFSPVWQLLPDDKVFDEEVFVSIVPEKYDGNRRRLGIYSVAGKGKYSHNGEKIEGDALTFSTRTGGSYIVLEDQVAPVINYVRRSSDYHLGSIAVFAVSDLGEGVDYLSASASINGVKAEVYSDPDKSEIYIALPGSGKRKIELQVADNAGNIARITRHN